MTKQKGARNYKASEQERLLDVVAGRLPLHQADWENVAKVYNACADLHWRARDATSLKRKFTALYSAARSDKQGVLKSDAQRALELRRKIVRRAQDALPHAVQTPLTAAAQPSIGSGALVSGQCSEAAESGDDASVALDSRQSRRWRCSEAAESSGGASVVLASGQSDQCKCSDAAEIGDRATGALAGGQSQRQRSPEAADSSVGADPAGSSTPSTVPADPYEADLVRLFVWFQHREIRHEAQLQEAEKRRHLKQQCKQRQKAEDTKTADKRHRELLACISSLRSTLLDLPETRR